jgi:iron complex transport system ATP-binding protein
LLLGVNGIGKSTLLRTLAGLLPPLSGSVKVNNIDIYSIKPTDRAQMISAVFTGRDFDSFITVRELVALGRYPHTGWMGRLASEDQETVSTALEMLKITHLSEKRVSQISDGERQKTLIAKSLCQNTPVIIMDEPTAFLDYKNKASLMEMIKRLSQELNKTILISTHDISHSLPFSYRSLLISESRHFMESDSKDEQTLKRMLELS